MVASAGQEKVINLWDLKSGEITRQMAGNKKKLGPLAFSRDGKRLVSGGFDKTVRLWDVSSGGLQFAFEDGEIEDVEPADGRGEHA